LPLLHWRLRPGAAPTAPATASAGGRDGFRLLLAPIKEAGEAAEPIGAFLAQLGAAEEDAESARLLYVAATRAAARLHLLAAVASRQGGQAALQAPPRRSLLAKCWPLAEAVFSRSLSTMSGTQSPITGGQAARGATPGSDRSGGVRLSAAWLLPDLPPAAAWPQGQAARAGDTVEFEWVSETLRHVGTVVHRWLQRMAEDALAGWHEVRIDALQPAFRRELASRGVAAADLDSATGRVRNALANALADERGRWLLGPQDAAQNEYRMTARIAGSAPGDGGARPVTVSVVIDRLFHDTAGRLWIVDYKTSSHEGTDVEGFLDREQVRYRGQLARYALVLSTPGTAPGATPEATSKMPSDASLGLYFPLLRGWREWEAGET